MRPVSKTTKSDQLVVRVAPGVLEALDAQAVNMTRAELVRGILDSYLEAAPEPPALSWFKVSSELTIPIHTFVEARTHQEARDELRRNRRVFRSTQPADPREVWVPSRPEAVPRRADLHALESRASDNNEAS